MASSNLANKAPRCKFKGSQSGRLEGKETTTLSQDSNGPLRLRLAASGMERARQLQSKKFGFFDLPGEIRNKIYDYVFDNRRVFIRKAHGQKIAKTEESVANKNGPSLQPRSDSAKGKDIRTCKPYCGLYSDSIINGRRVRHDDKRAHINIDILFTCRKAYQESMCLFYANTTFYFSSFKPIRRFLNHCRSEALAAIKNLEFYHVIYGEPALTVDREWKLRSDDRWMEICTSMSQKLTGLRRLRIDLRICDWPTQLNLEAAWAQPILELGERRFTEVKALLIHPCFKDNQLVAAARVLEEAMMCEDSVERRREEEALREVERQKRKEREREQQAALEKLPIAERIEWEAMLAADEEPVIEQAAKAPKVLKIIIPKNSPHWKQPEEKNQGAGPSNQTLDTAGPSSTQSQAQTKAPISTPKKKTAMNRGQVHEGGYHGHQRKKEPFNPYGEAGLRVMKWDDQHGTWTEKYILQPPAPW